MKFLLENYEETISLGAALAKFLRKDDCITLDGDLGAGKTAFVSGIVKGLGYNDYISSPTFTIVNEYIANIPVYHFDVYRVNDEEELCAIGFEEYFNRDGIVIIEWSCYIKGLLPKEYLEIQINTFHGDPNLREIELIPHGQDYKKMINKFNISLGGLYESSCR
jgi:tRNA threonylcarbamoyladenosine biosynthesis protein TsaE